MKTTDIKIKSPTGTDLKFVSDFAHQLSFVIGSHGLFSSGKSRLPVTGPDLTFIMPLDRKSRRTIEKTMKELGKKHGKNILLPPEDFIEDVNPMQAARLDIDESKKLYRRRVEVVKDYLLTAHAHKDVRFIALDTCSQMFEEMCYANYGREGYKVKKIGDEPYKDKSGATQEMIDLIRALSSKPLLLIHTSKDEYIKGKNKPVGMTLEGMKNMGYQCEVVIYHEFNKEFDAEDANKDWKFGLNFQTCQDNVELQGPDGKRILLDDRINIGNIMSLAFPDSDWSDWLV